MLLPLLVCGLAQASVVFGGAWSPSGVGALAWSDAGAFSGTLAGEYDGLLRPPLTAHGGWIGTKDAVTANFALVRFTDATFSSDNTYHGVGSTRFGVDYRRYLYARAAGRVDFYGTGGGYFVLPNAEDTSEAYTPEEQDQADIDSGVTRARIGGLGGQLGIGADYLFGDAAGRPAVGVGLRYVARLYRGQATSDTGYQVSTIVVTEAAFVLELQR